MINNISNMSLVATVITVIFVFVFLCIICVTIPQNKAGVITGLRDRVVIGSCCLVIPFFERIEYIPLNYNFLDTAISAYSMGSRQVNINIKARYNVIPKPDCIKEAARLFRSRKSKNICDNITEVVKMTITGKVCEYMSNVPDDKVKSTIFNIKSEIETSLKDEFNKMGLEVVITDCIVLQEKLDTKKAGIIELSHKNGRTIISVPTEYFYGMVSDEDIVIESSNKN